MIISLLQAISEPKTVEFTPAKRERLRKAYNAACEAGEDEFIFDGEEYVTDFAKYLLEYLDMTMETVH